jgi:hypothetical protein
MDAQDPPMMRRFKAVCACVLLCTPVAHAHVGSPDVYAEGQAGKYKLFVVVRPPLVIPGVADVEARAESGGVDSITITPIPMTGEAANHPPVPEEMKRPSSDAGFYTGHLWMMASGSWQIRFAVSGAQGNGVLSIPVPATAIGTRKMTPGLGTLLSALGVLLVLGMVGIVGAAAREAKLPPGAAATDSNRRNGYIAMAVTLALLATGIALGNVWWKSNATDYSGYIYKPLQMTTEVENGNVLVLKLRDPGWVKQRKLDDFIPDHDHLMHLYMIRWPEMDVVAHLHPQPTGTAEFQLPLPTMPGGTYRLYADVVHASGFPETIVGVVTLPAISGWPLEADDAIGAASPVKQTVEIDDGPGAPGSSEARFKLPDGYTMVWMNPGRIEARTPASFQFELLDREGKAPQDMALYMGMLGHAAFVKTDGSAFAHIHPTGTVSMAAFMMANPQAEGNGSSTYAGMAMPGMPEMGGGQSALPNVVGFPYGFPSSGMYRIFVQMKHGSTVETGVFDAKISGPAG